MTYQVLKWHKNTGVEPERDGPMLAELSNGDYLHLPKKGDFFWDINVDRTGGDAYLRIVKYAYLDEMIDPLEALLDGYEECDGVSLAQLTIWGKGKGHGHYRKKPVTPPKTPEQQLHDLIAQLGTEEALRRLENGSL